MEVIEELEPSMKGKSNTQRRKFIVSNMIEMAAVWQTGFDKLPHAKKQLINAVFKRDLERRNAQARDPGFLPKPGDFLPCLGAMHVSDHLSTIVHGLDEYYHCRRTECGCITCNATWPNTIEEGGGQYWCPDPS